MMTWGGGVWKQDLGVGPLSQVRLSVFKVDVIGPSYGAADFSGDMSADDPPLSDPVRKTFASCVNETLGHRPLLNAFSIRQVWLLSEPRVSHEITSHCSSGLRVAWCKGRLLYKLCRSSSLVGS